MPTSDSFLESIYATSSGDPILTLLRVDFDGVFHHFANNNESVTSNVSGSSQLYQPAAFAIALPEDTSDGTPTATLEFDPSDIQIVRLLRSAEERINVTMWLVVADEPNVAEFGPVNYESTSFSISAAGVSATLEVEPILDVTLPAKRYTPQTFPGLWDGQQ